MKHVPSRKAEGIMKIRDGERSTTAKNTAYKKRCMKRSEESRVRYANTNN